MSVEAAAGIGGNQPRLAIIVPYRDRLHHLQQFIPHMQRYFEAQASVQPITIHVVEQFGTAPFNRGKLINCGFDIVRDATDYVVFHDIDYLPEKADYSFTPQPTRLIWHGLTLREDYQTFFGAVCGMSCVDFIAVNGFSNEFWHWGCEDIDLRLRCESSGLVLARRDGVFRSLQHQHNGFCEQGRLRPEVIPNFERLRSRWGGETKRFSGDGLDSLSYEIVDSYEFKGVGYGFPAWRHVVKIGEPRPV